MTTDQIINYDGKIPKEVVIEDKTTIEQMRLIEQLDEGDKKNIFWLPIYAKKIVFLTA